MTNSKLELSDFAEKVKEIDKSRMKSDLDRWPELAENAWASSEWARLDSKASKIIVVGMGGSGITGDMLRSISDESRSRTMLMVVKDDVLPAWVHSDAAIIGISCSGNTQETLAAIAHAEKLG